jgi:hypothetical protein
MYWSGCQSTGAEMRKYLTATASVWDTSSQFGGHINARLHWRHISFTYGCRLAGALRCCQAVGFAARPGLIERSRVRQIVPEAAASACDVRKDTCCAATRSCVECLGV